MRLEYSVGRFRAVTGERSEIEQRIPLLLMVKSKPGQLMECLVSDIPSHVYDGVVILVRGSGVCHNVKMEYVCWLRELQ